MVQIIRSLTKLREWRLAQTLARRKVGFVPTMGALHAGHIDLIRQSMAATPATVISIFVNPSQFAPHEDLSKYPRSFEKDIAEITEVSRSARPEVEPVVFMPEVDEMYPSGIELDRTKQVGAFVEVLGLSHQLEGLVRPHFFRGVATVVSKLFNAIQPDVAFFGQKDIQQVSVVRRMVKDLLFPIEIVMGKTAREKSGLAMSSRNQYLDPETRQKATVLYRALKNAENEYNAGETSSKVLVDIVKKTLSAEPVVKNIEYVEITDLESLSPQENARPGSVLSAAIALNSAAGTPLRILDNIIL
ncbi:Pantothenate synthetase [Wickerhamiella sorbophila]|uniref:Pantoate--beta-alanine ligase n=1 Tax=Wickerhamiella sorbophila TaxID=45607 RepID=A0A2T0FEP9_9ASCO|nr:Pantothenate synthetase [Wickerhamiella sorbophila]PRT53468.1 Pantothenate synthetase [Wickerhamiella sorbophila]